MTGMMELVEKLREDARQMWKTGLVPEGATPLAEQAASAIDRLSTQVEELRGGLREAERVATVTADYFLKRGDKEVAAEHIRFRTIFRALASEQTGGESPPALIQKENGG